jgi:hypothetical protein
MLPGSTVVRRRRAVHAYIPVSIDLAHQQTGVLTKYPNITITDVNNPVLRPTITDSQGNPGCRLTPRARLLAALRDSVLAGQTFNRNLHRRSERRQPHQWSWSIGLSQQIGGVSAGLRLRRQRVARPDRSST